METLNLEWLTNRGACQPARDAFHERWGDADVPLADVLLWVADRPGVFVWLDWLATRCDSVYRVFRQYEVVCAPINEQCWIAIKPFVQQRDAARREVLRRLADGLTEVEVTP